MGNGSKAVITGDLTQIDLPNPKKSGLVEALQVLDGVEGISFCHFEDVDVVRHHLVQRIVRAYDSYGRAQQMPLELNDAAMPANGLQSKPAGAKARLETAIKRIRCGTIVNRGPSSPLFTSRAQADR